MWRYVIHEQSDQFLDLNISQIELSTQETSKSMGYRTANRNQRAKQLARIQGTKET